MMLPAPRESTGRLNEEERLALRNARTISVALIVGVVLFGAIVGGIITKGPQPAAPPPAPVAGSMPMPTMLTGVAAVLLLTAIPLVVVLRRRIAEQSVDPDTGRVEPVKFVTIAITTMALLEAPALLGIVACLVGKSMMPGGIVALAGVLVMMGLLPRAAHFDPPALRSARETASGVHGFREPEKWK